MKWRALVLSGVTLGTVLDN